MQCHSAKIILDPSCALEYLRPAFVSDEDNMADPGSMLLFMPWCKLDKTYNVGEIELIPFAAGFTQHIAGLGANLHPFVDKIIGMYKTIEGNPIERAAFIRFADKPPTASLSDDELDLAEDHVAIACFAGLSQRQYFGVPNIYCNSDCFLFHVQRFIDAEFVAFSSHRRAGRITEGGYKPTKVSITVPMNCHAIEEVTLDERLLDGLLKQRAAGKDWGRWQNAISCFNQANTDGSTVHYQIEWMLLASAYEHLLAAKSHAKDVACKFTAALQPAQDVLMKDASRRSQRMKDDTRPLRFEWIREFYSVRGDFAHGKLMTQQTITWNPLEHLVLATIAFPLVAKSLLQQQGRYELSDDDRAQIDIFERFADTNEFLCEPPEQKGSNDTHWLRLFGKRHMEVIVSKGVDEAAQELREKFPGFLDDEGSNADGSNA